MRQIETDYLVIGSGASGMAFTDTLIDETNAHVTLVDRHGKPGGHWNDAYSFVTLHQPSLFYGVNSMPLGSGRIDTLGLNKGLYELASGPEISAYYERVMNQKLLPSGRVSYHPMCNYLGDGQFESLLSGERTQVTVRRKLVDAQHFSPTVPSTHTPRFEVDDGVRLVPPNALPQLWSAARGGSVPHRFVILGAGKTAMDAAIWLMQAGATPSSLQWVMPRDPWVVNRETTQPGQDFFEATIGSQADQMEAFGHATSLADLFLRLEACRAVLRIHADHTPSMFHLATLAPSEVRELQRIADVVRLGRVQRIAADHLQLEHGRVPVLPGTLFVDCTASAVEVPKTEPIFQGDKIVLQLLRLPLPSFSSALIAYIEAHYPDEKDKARLARPVTFPRSLADYPRSVFESMSNQFEWSQDKTLRQWIRASRLDGYGKLLSDVDPQDAERQAIMARLKEQTKAAAANLPRLLALSEAAR